MFYDYVFGLIGCIGGGKSYRLQSFIDDVTAKGYKVVTGDFSDGIRDLVTYIITGIMANNIDVNSEKYGQWKGQIVGKIKDPSTMDDYMLSGRDLLRNVGEGTKWIAGLDVWAKYTGEKVYNAAVNVKGAGVIFGSVRFSAEAEAVCRVAKLLHRSPKFIFCDYHSPRYDCTSDHVSERLAQAILHRGATDGEDVTNHVKQILWKNSTSF